MATSKSSLSIRLFGKKIFCSYGNTYMNTILTFFPFRMTNFVTGKIISLFSSRDSIRVLRLWLFSILNQPVVLNHLTQPTLHSNMFTYFSIWKAGLGKPRMLCSRKRYYCKQQTEVMSNHDDNLKSDGAINNWHKYITRNYRRIITAMTRENKESVS